MVLQMSIIKITVQVFVEAHQQKLCNYQPKTLRNAIYLELQNSQTDKNGQP